MSQGTDIAIEFPQEEVARFCERWGVGELALFGSVTTDKFGPTSDVDILVTFLPETMIGLFGLARMRAELSGIFGRAVDLLSRRAVEASRNPTRRRAILDSARTIYAA